MKSTPDNKTIPNAFIQSSALSTILLFLTDIVNTMFIYNILDNIKMLSIFLQFSCLFIIFVIYKNLEAILE